MPTTFPAFGPDGMSAWVSVMHAWVPILAVFAGIELCVRSIREVARRAVEAYEK